MYSLRLVAHIRLQKRAVKMRPLRTAETKREAGQLFPPPLFLFWVSQTEGTTTNYVYIFILYRILQLYLGRTYPKE